MAPNLDKHPTMKGAYIAYDAEGFAFRVTKIGATWAAKPSYAAAATDFRRIRADKLGELAAKVGASKREAN